jgi:uncharacterized protein
VRLVIDTNILVSALLASTSLPAHLIVLWREGRFDLLTAADFLVTGDKRDLLELKLHEGTRIITVRDFLTMTGRLP